MLSLSEQGIQRFHQEFVSSAAHFLHTCSFSKAFIVANVFLLQFLCSKAFAKVGFIVCRTMLFIYTAHEARFQATFFKYIVALVRAILVQRWICIPSRNCSSLPPCTSQAVQLILSCLPVPRRSPFLPSWCLQQHYPVLQSCATSLPRASLVPPRLSKVVLSLVPPWCLAGCPIDPFLPGASQAV